MPFAAGCLLTAAAAAVAQDGETYTLTYVAGTGGTLEIDSGNGAVPFRTANYNVIIQDESAPSIKITAIPNNSYRFVIWNDDTESPSRNVDKEEATSSKTFTASFIKTYTLTYAAGTNGKIRVGENPAILDSYDIVVDSNTTGPTVTAVPGEGYDFVKWDDNSTNPEHIVEAVKSNATFTATFAIKTYTLTYAAESGGKLQVNSVDVETPHSVSRTHGSTGPAVTAVANTGYNFVGWSDGKATPARTDAAVGNMFLTANFAPKTTIKISTFDQLKKIGRDAAYPLNESYELTADINASASRDGGAGFKPIGAVYFYGNILYSDSAFSGKFDGKGFKVSGLYINRPASDSGTGLFGYVRNAEIKNVAVVDADIKGRGYVGALAGRVYGSTVSGCYTSGTVAGDSVAGGLIGAVDAATGAVTGCYTSAAVSGKNTLGGLVGRNGMSSKVTRCYSAGTVTGTGDVAGGLVGYNDFEIQDSYSTATVKGKNRVGGFVGESHYNAMNFLPGGSNTITQCYSAGLVTGESSVGGFVGLNDNSSIIRFCNWDKDVSGQTSAGSGAGASVTGKITAEMSAMGKSAIIEGWDYYGASWGVSNGYPYLINLPTDTITFKAVTQGSGIAAGRVAGKSELAQIVNRGVNGAPVAASLVSDEDGVQVGDSLAGWYLAGGNNKIASGANAGFNAKVSGDTLALSKIGGNVVIEARFALKKYAVTYISRIRADGNYIDRTGGKVEVKTGSDVVETADSVSVTREYGTVFTASAVPDTGYRFRRWGNNPDDSVAVRRDTVKGPVTIYAVFAAAPVSVLTPDRNVPQINFEEEAVVIPPVVITAGEFTAGPNPVPKRSGIVNFFRLGRRVAACELRIYDATGNIINRIKISDNAFGNLSKRIVGSWDLKDAKGRPVSEGTYLVKGVVKTSDGKSEKISLLLSIR